MATYPTTNIFLNKIDDKTRKNIEEVKTYLEIKGVPYSQNSDNNCAVGRLDLHYFMGNSVVKITQFSNVTDIKIIANNGENLSSIKKSIERILDGEKVF